MNRIVAVLLSRVIAAGLLAWSIATAWAWTVTGAFEPASLDVDYFDAGAGNDLLLARGCLALGLAFLAVLWACLPGTPSRRLLRLAIAPSILMVLLWSVASLDRTSPGFSEAKFMEVLEAHQAGQKFSLQDVWLRLGNPLMTARRGDHLMYSYTFTPSGGFGWHKRVLTFDAQGLLIDVLYLDEP
jgi:hypothetical protein